MQIPLCRAARPAQRRFVSNMFLSALGCVLFSLVSAVFFRLVHHAPFYIAWPMAVLPALPILGALLATGAYLKEEKDEFQRDLFVQALLYATGITLAVVTASAYLKAFAGVPALQLVWVYPMFWVFAGLSIAVLMRRYR